MCAKAAASSHVPWSLVSNSGRERITWLPTGIEGIGDEAALRCDIVLEGRFFGEALESGPPGAPADFALTIRGLSVRVSTLERLFDLLKQWRDLPLSQMRTRRLELDCDMGGLFDQQVRLIVGDRSDTLSSGHPVATVRYVVGRMSGELSFVTDQSCLFGLQAGIGEALASLRPSGNAPG